MNSSAPFAVAAAPSITSETIKMVMAFNATDPFSIRSLFFSEADCASRVVCLNLSQRGSNEADNGEMETGGVAD
jgi:hypothetical protein